MCSVLGMKCRGRGLAPESLKGCTEKKDWDKKFIEVCGIYAKFLNNQKIRFVYVLGIRGTS